MLKGLSDAITDTDHQTVFQQTLLKELEATRLKVKHINPYVQTKDNGELLEKMGIAVDPYATQLHNHPASKVIENQTLAVIGNYIRNRPTTFIFLKPSKLNMLGYATDQPHQIINCQIEPKDLVRYPDVQDSPFSDILYPDVVIIDAMHHYPLETIWRLIATHPHVERVYMTLVIPPEVAHRHASRFPSLYTLRYRPNGFTFLPDGHAAGAYDQSYDCLDWLRYNKIVGPGLTVSGQRLEAYGANFIYLWARGDLVVSETLSVDCEDLVTLPQIYYDPAYDKRPAFPRRFVTKIILYALALGEVRNRDIWAKFRQLLNDKLLTNFEPHHALYLCDFAEQIAKVRGSSPANLERVFKDSVLVRTGKRTIAELRHVFQPFLDRPDFLALEYLLTLCPFLYDIPQSTRFVDQPLPQLIPKALTHPHTTFTSTCKNRAVRYVLSATIVGALRLAGAPTPALYLAPAVANKLASLVAPVETTTCDSHCIFNPPHAETQQMPGTFTPDEAPSDSQLQPPPYFLGEDDDSDITTDSDGFVTPLERPLRSQSITPIHLADDDFLRGHYRVGPMSPPPIVFGNFDDDDTEPPIRHGPLMPEEAPVLEFESEPAFEAPPREIFRLDVDRNLMARHRICEDDTCPEHYTGSGPWALCSCGHGFFGDNGTDCHNCPEARVVAEYPTPPHDSPPPPDEDEDNDHEGDYSRRDVQLLQAHGFKNLEAQFTIGGRKIHPIIRNEVMQKLAPPTTDGLCGGADSLLTELCDLLRDRQRNIYNHTIDKLRARDLASDEKNGRYGKLGKDKRFAGKVRLIDALASSDHDAEQVSLCHISGAGGSGKSQCLQEVLKKYARMFNLFVVVVPTQELRKDWLRKISPIYDAMVKTFELALVQTSAPVVIFDDFGKLPAGLIDLYLRCQATPRLVILTGDYRQSVCHVSEADSRIRNNVNEVDYFWPYADYYLNCTHRNPKNIANALEVFAARSDDGLVSYSEWTLDDSPILVPSTTTVTAFEDYGHGSYTYAGCQGLTKPKVQIFLNSNTLLCSDRVMYTALSRASEEIVFVNTYSDDEKFLNKLRATTYLPTFLQLVHEGAKAPEVQCAPDYVPPEPEIATHLAVENHDVAMGKKLEDMPEKYEREMYTDAGFSNTDRTDNDVIRAIPRHQGRDEPLVIATERRRLGFSTLEENEKELRDNRDLACMLFNSFRRAWPLPDLGQEFDETLWNNCRAEIEHKFLQKAAGMIKAAADRQHFDASFSRIKIFLKQQWVKKVEKFAKPVNKPGQTIMAFMQWAVMITGTAARYVRRVLWKFKRENIYMHCEQDIPDLARFVSTWDYSKPRFASDYTDYDASQDGSFLGFELMLWKWCGVPEEIRKFYRRIKLEALVFDKILQIMRGTGEGPTWDSNTVCNIAYHHLKYVVDPESPQCYSGDDIITEDIPTLNPLFKKVERRFKLIGKPETGYFLDFCGWRPTMHGLVRSPLKLNFSLKLAAAEGKMHDAVQSYGLDAQWAYDLGDRLYDIFDEDEISFHQENVRMLVTAGYDFTNSPKKFVQPTAGKNF